MGFIKSNKGLIIGILVGVFVIGAVFLISTKTGLFDEDERLFNNIEENVDETGEVIVGDTPEEDADTTGIVEVPEEIKGFVELPSGQSVVDGTNEDGTFNTVEAEVTQMWEQHFLGVDDTDESIVREAKEQLRVSTYEDYMALKEQGMSSVEQDKVLDLGFLGYPEKDNYVYKTNTVVDLGDIKIVGANIGGNMVSATFDVQNNSEELLDMEEVQNQLQFRFTEDIGLGTDWFGIGDSAVGYTGIEEYNSEGYPLNKYLGRDLTKPVSFLPVDTEASQTLLSALDIEGDVDTDLVMQQVGELTTEAERGEYYSRISLFQDNLPDELKLEVKYGEETSDYTILKDNGGLGYNYEEALN